ncbi:MAG: peptidoglycan-binding protein [Thermodesulfobacteriota bacterium]|nr:peptidoglycan-binding protein [Anaerolineae bacterium]RKX57714.1 MAG: peptidoglycan-binding protein [Thermodesulfobacteriota bacterium]
MALVKAYITNLDAGGERIECLFNPSEYTFTKSNRWEAVKIMGGDVPMPKFTGGGAMTLKMQLFFDTYEKGTDVRKYTDKLLKLMSVDPNLKNAKTKKGRPPRCMFNWGQMWSFKAIITQMSQKFTLFLEDGTPVRATVDVTFQQVEQEGTYPPQNPTSGGGPARKHRLVRPGDRIDWIAYEEYGDSSLWRLIADENDLENPLQLTPGQVLVIVPPP